MIDMKYNKLKKIELKMLISILLAFCFTTNIASQKSTKEEIRIPIVSYKPTNFTKEILESFSATPYSHYIILRQNDKCITEYLEVFEGRKRVAYSKPSIYEELVTKSLEQDSMFFLNFKTVHYSTYIPLKYYGFVKDGNIELYCKGDTIPCQLNSIIIKEFGSIDRFKMMLEERAYNAIHFNIKNGIYASNIDDAKKHLANNYSYYADCFPSNKDTILRMYKDFVKSTLNLDSKKIKLLDKSLTQLLNKGRVYNYERYHYWPNSVNHEVLLGEESVINIINDILTSEQIDLLRIKMKEAEYLCFAYYSFIVKYDKKRQLKIYRKSQEQFQGKDKYLKASFHYYNEEEEFEMVKEMVFKENQNSN